MNKRISLGAAIAFMAIIAAVTFAITMVYSMMSFDDMVNHLREREAMYSKLAEIDRYVRQNYNGKIDEDYLMDQLAGGYLKGTGDAHALYLSAEEYSRVQDLQNGKIVGIGIAYEKDQSGYIRVKEIYTGSPAAEAMQVEDRIIQIDGVDITAENYDQSAAQIRGEPGTKIALIVRRGTEDIPLELTRRYVEAPTVYSSNADGVGYIKITEFGDYTPEQFDKHLFRLMDAGVQALVFDVRGNPGGTVKSVAKVLDRLLPEGDIVSATFKDGRTEVLARSDAGEVSLPMVVLTNEKTASSAELFVQALKDYDKAKSVGTKTVGKGSMQTVYKLLDGSAIDITIAKYNPPKSPNFDKIGIRPDYEVKLAADQTLPTGFDPQNDAQLKKAMELAVASIKIEDAVTESESSQAASQPATVSSEAETTLP